RHPRRDAAARRVDVEVDVLVGVLALEEEELGHDEVRHAVVDGPDEEDHALLQQARIDVVGAFAAPRLLDHHRYQPEAARLLEVLVLLVLDEHGQAFRVPIRSSNGVAVSSTFIFPMAHSTTLSSITSASTSASRLRSP